MQPFEFLIVTLAAYRIAHLVVFDKIAEPFRRHFVKRSVLMVNGLPQVYFSLQGGAVRSSMGRVINCFWCAGIWVAIGVSVLYWLFPPIIGAYVILAVAAVISLIETIWAKVVGFPEMQEQKEARSSNENPN